MGASEMHGQEIELSVVVPVYRSEGCIAQLLAELQLHLPAAVSDFEIILVDDDSPDRSWEIIQRESASYPAVKAVRLMRNAGQVQATLCGLALARGDFIVTMDDDLQHSPDQVAQLLNALRADQQLDCVFGTFAERRHQGYRTAASRLIGWIHADAYALPQGVRPSSFRAMRRLLAKAIVQDAVRSPSLNVAILESTRHIGSVPVGHAERFAGQSNYTLARQFRQAFDNLCSSGTLPLRTVWILGSSMLGLGLAAGLAVLGYGLIANSAPAPWAWVAVLQLFLCGIVLWALGLLAEYMVRIIRRARGGNRFIIRQSLNCSVVDGCDVACPERQA